MDEKAQAKKNYDAATDEWERLSDIYEDKETQFAEAEFEESGEVDMEPLRKAVMKARADVDAAMAHQLDTLRTLEAFSGR